MSKWGSYLLRAAKCSKLTGFKKKKKKCDRDKMTKRTFFNFTQYNELHRHISEHVWLSLIHNLK